MSLPLIPFVAIASNSKEKGFTIETSFCTGDSYDEERYKHYAAYKLGAVDMKCCQTLYKSQIGRWYVKGDSDLIYIVVLSPEYPDHDIVAIECLDELSAGIQEARIRKKRGTWRWRRKVQVNETAAQNVVGDHALDCCRGVVLKYGSTDLGSAAQMLMTETDSEIRECYSEKVENLMDEVDQLAEAMNKNILAEYERAEKMENLMHISEDLNEQAKVFKKRAKKLKWTMWAKENKGMIIGTAVVTTGGGVAGFLAGGPAGAAVLTPMASVAAAQTIEAASVAAICGVGFLGSASAANQWFANQKFVFV